MSRPRTPLPAQPVPPPAARESLFASLTRADVSYEKLVEFESKLIAATRAGLVSWSKEMGHAATVEYHYSSRAGTVYASRRGVTIYDCNGRQERRFHYGTDDLYEAAEKWFAEMADAVITSILADLEAMATG